MKTSFSTLALMSLAVVPFSAHALTDADIDRSFFPYRDGVPTVPGLVPGMVLTKSNVANFKDAMDPGLFLAISSGVSFRQGCVNSAGTSKADVN